MAGAVPRIICVIRAHEGNTEVIRSILRALDTGLDDTALAEAVTQTLPRAFQQRQAVAELATVPFSATQNQHNSGLREDQHADNDPAG